MSCPIHGPLAECSCRYVLESALFTVLMLGGAVWLVGDKVYRTLRGLLT